VGLLVMALCFLSGGYFFQTRRRSRWLTLIAVTTLVVGPLAAFAAVALPHTFVNGTIADADEVNANFAAITADFSRYELTLTAADAHDSVPVPPAVVA
jgi:hypothetical protein